MEYDDNNIIHHIITSLLRCLTHFTGSTVNVDIFSLAGVATEVEDLRMLSRLVL